MRILAATLVAGLTAGLTAGLATTASARTWTVHPPGVPPIQSAVDMAADGDTIMLANGLYAGIGGAPVDLMGKALVVRSQSGIPQYCIVNCEGSVRGFFFRSGEGPDTILEGITVNAAHATNYFNGGALIIEGSSPTIRHCAFTNGLGSRGQAGSGGGAYIDEASSPRFYDCIFQDLYSNFHGAAVYCEGTALFERCQFYRNSNFEGFGAVTIVGDDWAPGAGVFRDCLFAGNIAYFSGAAVYANGRFSGCTFRNNSSSAGGGAIATLSARIVDCTFEGNSSFYEGGGAIFCGTPWFVSAPDHVPNAGVEVIRCSIAGGEVYPRNGGAIYSEHPLTIDGCTIADNFQAIHLDAPAGTPLVIRSSILAFNTDGPAVETRNPAQITIACTDIAGNDDGDWTDDINRFLGIDGNFSEDPLFCRGTADTPYTLRADSPCLNDHHTDGDHCAPIGRFGAGCTVVTVERESWGGLKARYRTRPDTTSAPR